MRKPGSRGSTPGAPLSSARHMVEMDARPAEEWRWTLFLSCSPHSKRLRAFSATLSAPDAETAAVHSAPRSHFGTAVTTTSKRNGNQIKMEDRRVPWVWQQLWARMCLDAFSLHLCPDCVLSGGKMFLEGLGTATGPLLNQVPVFQDEQQGPAGA